MTESTLEIAQRIRVVRWNASRRPGWPILPGREGRIVRVRREGHHGSIVRCEVLLDPALTAGRSREWLFPDEIGLLP